MKTHEFERHGPFGSVLGLFVFFIFVFPAFVAPFGATLLGWIAVSQIRRSAGKLYGLWLAVFDGLLFPLLVLDFLIWAALIAIGRILVQEMGWHLGQADLLAFVFLAMLGISAFVDWLIIRAVWRAVNSQPDEAGVNVAPATRRTSRVALALLFGSITVGSLLGLIAHYWRPHTASLSAEQAVANPLAARPLSSARWWSGF